MNQARFQKQQREKARKEKAAAKEARREERRSADDSAEPVDQVDQDAVIAELAALHQRYEAGEVEFEDFLDAKDELTARLDIR